MVIVDPSNVIKYIAVLVVFLCSVVSDPLVADEIDEIQPGQWYEVPNSKLQSAFPPVSPPGVMGPRAVVDAWSGGVYDTLRDRLVIWGGGHTDYSGNEVYAFDLNSKSWSRLTDPSPNVGGDESTGVYPDGLPRSRHTYNSLVYAENVDKFMTLGAFGVYSSGGGNRFVHAFDFNDRTWDNSRTPVPKFGVPLTASAYDPVTGNIWVASSSTGGRLMEYNPTADAWATHASLNMAYYGTAAIDTVRHNMLVVGGYGGQRQILLFDLDNPKAAPQVPATSGATDLEKKAAPGLAYDPVLDKYVGWAGGGDVYLLDPETFVWTKKGPAANNTVIPTSANANGTYGRFRYIPSRNVYIAVNRPNENVYIYRLSENQPPPAPEPDPTAIRAYVHSRSASAQSDVPVTFGQVFKAGDVPVGQNLAAHLENGQVVPLQVDVKATHADGSVRHAILTAKLPSLGAHATEQLVLSNNGTPLGGTVSLNALLANGFDAQVSLNVGGTQYKASAAQMLAGGNVQTWLQGPLVSEWIVGGPVKNANGAPHPHLAAYFHVRGYDTLDRARVDVVVENGWTFVSNPTAYTYDATITVGGNTVYSKQGLTHYHHTRWHQPFYWGDPVTAVVTHDYEYLQATQAVPNYLDGLKPLDSAYTNLVKTIVPMQRANLRAQFSEGGADPQIGPLPLWDALYMISGDIRAYDSVLANGSAGGSYSVHYRDETTGLPVSIADHPNITLQDNSLPRGTGGNPLVHDQAHQPSMGYVAYMLTGDYYYLEEMQFWATWNFLYANGAIGGYRQGTKGIFGVQVRGQAWAMRQLGQTAYLTPDTHPHKQYYIDRVIYNLEHNENLYPLNPDGNRLGVIMTYDAVNEFAPWMDDFYTWTMGYLVELGFNRATTMRDFKAIFPTGRMGLGPDEYCFNSAAPYRYTIGLSKKQTDVWPDFRTLYEQNRPDEIGMECNSQAMADYLAQKEGGTFVVGQIIGRAYSPSSYYANLQPALAVAVDAGVADYDVHWARFWTNAPVRPDYRNYPVWAVVPRNTAASVP
jgi:hypothetical protein